MACCCAESENYERQICGKSQHSEHSFKNRAVVSDHGYIAQLKLEGHASAWPLTGIGRAEAHPSDYYFIAPQDADCTSPRNKNRPILGGSSGSG